MFAAAWLPLLAARGPRTQRVRFLPELGRLACMAGAALFIRRLRRSGGPAGIGPAASPAHQTIERPLESRSFAGPSWTEDNSGGRSRFARRGRLDRATRAAERHARPRRAG